MSLAVTVARAGSQGGTMRPGMAGDPGLGSFLGGVVRGIGRGIAGGLTGGVGGAISAIAAGRGQRSGVPNVPVMPGLPSFAPQGGGRNGRVFAEPSAVRRGRQAAIPFGRTGLETVACPSGHRPNKTSYFLNDGTFIEVGTRCVKNRKRNPLNPRALSKAMGRLTSAKLASKAMGRISIRKNKC